MNNDLEVPVADDPRTGRSLIDATRPYLAEDSTRTRLEVLVTFVLLAILISMAVARVCPWFVRVPASVAAGLIVVRGFILYHDFQHGALLRGSRIGKQLFGLYGLLVLTPPSVWRATHNYHHAHTAKLVGSHVGSFWTVTVDMYAKLTPRERALYRFVRSPLNVAMGYLTVFLYGMCVGAFLRNKRKHFDGLVALLLHLAISTALLGFFGIDVWLLGLVVPLVVACAVGGYLFYAQHNFEGIEIQPRETWEYTRAALESSSYLRTGPVMRWITANIGYHHVHHLNPGIPFYRLPEAMAAIPELGNPHQTALTPREILACFRLKLWDPAQHRMVPYPAA
jgi:acyl-lipid omega-6 desaturase (Delta-12 desaturase)